jgi:uncharacterized protein YqgC (DUF456 family)
MNNKLKPAIIGGVVVGLLSAIPFVNLPNICCCLWAILGGAIASYMYIKNSPTPVKTGEGAILGVLAGVVGAVIYIVIGIPLSILAGNALSGLIVKMLENADPSSARQMRRQMMNQSVVMSVVWGFVWALLLLVFSTLGGLIGVPIFEKRKGNPTPPPQGFGGVQPGAGSAP